MTMQETKTNEKKQKNEEICLRSSLLISVTFTTFSAMPSLLMACICVRGTYCHS